MEKITYLVDATGESALQIVGNYWRGEKDKGIILLHMMPATKESWNTFAEHINKKGWHVLAIDLRGHGESTLYKYDHTGENIDYRDFSDKEHQKTINDVVGAINFLKGEGLSSKDIYVGGASIGANLAIEYLSKNQEAPGVFALSPGLNYKGIEIKQSLEDIIKKEKVLLVASKDDTYSEKTVQELSSIVKIPQNIRIFESGGHGTALFEAHPELISEIIEWISTNK